jgi:hypothetical protein
VHLVYSEGVNAPLDMAVKIVITASFMLPVVALGQTDAAINTTVCEIVRSPAMFNGKLISIRAPVQIAFENFGLSVSECVGSRTLCESD